MGEWKIWLNEYQNWQPLPDWYALEKAFETLDKSLYLRISLKDDTCSMQIYGGDGERMLVEHTRLSSPAIKSVLYDRSQTQHVPIYNSADEQIWEHLPPEMCVSRSLAKETLKYFYETKHQLRRRDLGWGEWPDIWELRGKLDERPQVVSEWSQIEAAVDAMNNITHSSLDLASNKSEIEIQVQGGNEGRVEVIWHDGGYNILFILMDRTQTTPIALRLHNKMRTDLDPQFCVDKSLAKQALKYFFETKKRDETLHWVNWSFYV
jgi:hypothetical protein